MQLPSTERKSEAEECRSANWLLKWWKVAAENWKGNANNQLMTNLLTTNHNNGILSACWPEGVGDEGSDQEAEHICWG